jgi:hypothetical protein
MAAVGCALAGGVGAAVLAMVAPMLMHNYTDATPAGQALIAQFPTVLQVVWRAIWQFLDAILLAAWWLGIVTLSGCAAGAPLAIGDPVSTFYDRTSREPSGLPGSAPSTWRPRHAVAGWV